MSRAILAVLFVLTIAFCGNFVFSKTTERWGGLDLTEDSIYTLSEGSERIVAGLQKPLTMHLFYAKETANKDGRDVFFHFHNYYYYVRDLLRAYERESGGKIELLEYDPKPFSDEADLADRYEIRAVPLNETKSFYFGLAVTSGGGARETIPFFWLDLQPQLEFRISELIDAASRRKKTTIGVLSSLPITGSGMSPYMRQMRAMQGLPAEEAWATVEALKRSYEIEDVATDAEEIDEALDYLLVVHPQNLSQQTLYAIDQFVMRGGKLLAFVDPFCASQPSQQQQNMFGGGGEDKSSSLNALTKAWGLELAEGEFAGDLEVARRRRGRSGRVILSPGEMHLTGERLAAAEVVTQNLTDVDLAFAGAIRKTDAEGVEVAPLLTTSERGNTWTASSFELGGPFGFDAEALAGKFEEGAETLWLAARATGTLKSAFPDGAPEDEEIADGDAVEEPAEGEADTPHVAESVEPTSVILVADVDMLADGMAWARSFIGYEMANSNVAFLLNALDFLAGSSDLIAVRTRKQFNRPFTVVDEIERQADLATAKQVEAINAEIEQFRSQLSELNSKATEENVGLLQSEAYESQRRLEAKIREKERELRDVQKTKLDAIDDLGARIENLNVFGVPAIVAIVGIVLFVMRTSKRREQVRGGVA